MADPALLRRRGCDARRHGLCHAVHPAGIATHAIGLLVFFTLVWPGDVIQQVVGGGTTELWVSLHAAQTLLFAVSGHSCFHPPRQQQAEGKHKARSDRAIAFDPFGLGSNDFLNALSAHTGALYWHTYVDTATPPLLSS